MVKEKTSLILRLDTDTKDNFDHYCKSQGVSVSETIRQFIEEKVGESKVKDKIESTGLRWKVVNTRLTDSEYQSLMVRVRTENTTISKWLLRLIREQIIDAPQLRAEEIQAINQALFRLQSVGRNLNQYMKYVHKDNSLLSDVESLEIQVMKESIQETTQTIKALIQAATVRDFDYV